MPYQHISVMTAEVLQHLDCRPGEIMVDGTLGGAGHAAAILTKILPDGLLIGIDQDLDAISHAREALMAHRRNVRLFHGNFVRLPEFLSQMSIEAVDGILLDLGLSWHHLSASGRGFSFNRDEPLDMRMDITSDATAEAIVNDTREEELRNIFTTYGEERWARRIARNIVACRKNRRITSSRELAEIVCRAVPGKSLHGQKIHPATRVFMALRIVVNRELEVLESFLQNIDGLLRTGGRLCVLSFHSLEDRIVKGHMKLLATGCVCPPDFPTCNCNRKQMFRLLTRRVVKPAAAEIERNPMARSTRLRACVKL